jgi:hypothetical protein
MKRMYIENVRLVLENMSLQERSRLAEETRKILRNNKLIKKTTKNFHIENALNNFINGKEDYQISRKYLDGFLLALDSLYLSGAAIDALVGSRLKKQITWRNLLFRITKDISSPQLDKYKENEMIIKEFKNLFKQLVEISISEDEQETMQTLKVLNGLLNKSLNK